MRILFDNQCFYLHGKGGISRYISNYIESLKNQKGVEVIFKGHAVFDFFAENKDFKQTDIRGLNRIRLELEKRKDLKFIRKHIAEADIYIPTFYQPEFLPFFEKAETKVILHDFIHEKFPDQTQNAQLNAEWKKKYIENASSLITVSNSTKEDLLRIYPNVFKEIEVKYPVSNLISLKSEKIDLAESYHLYVGVRKGYKNFDFLIRPAIFEKIEQLVLVGGKNLSKEELNRIKSIGVENKITHIFPTDSQLKYIYENAEALISTSLYEGFGLPLLEARECGTKILAYDTKVSREVGGPNCQFFSSEKELMALL